MTPVLPNYHDRLKFRAEELIQQRQLQTLVEEFKGMGLTAYELDVEMFFSLIHEGYRHRCMEEKAWENANWDYQI